MKGLVGSQSWSRRHIVLLSSSGLLFLFLIFAFWRPSGSSINIFSHAKRPLFPPPLPIENLEHHPIDDLIVEADKKLAKLAEAETHSLHEAAKAYRKHRGRNPPPNFDLWYQFAKEKNVSVIEPLFDQIYESLEPFWSLEPRFLRTFPHDWPRTLTIRNGEIFTRSIVPSMWLNYWSAMLQQLPTLPDVDLAMRDADEPAVMVSFASMQKHMESALKTKREQARIKLSNIKNGFPTYTHMDYNMKDKEPEENREDFTQSNRTLWDLLSAACRPDDPIHQSPSLMPNASIPPVFSTNYTVGSTKGFVSNYTTARNPCYNPNIRTLHGMFIKSLAEGIYTELVPVFSVCKIVGANNDILVPPPTHYFKTQYSGPEQTIAWKTKKNAAVWRGMASGGDHDPTNWWGFHRHRFIQAMNGTAQSLIEAKLKILGSNNPSVQELEETYPDQKEIGLHNLGFPLRHLYGIAAQSYGKLGKWMQSMTNGGFVNMNCGKWAYYNSFHGGPKTCDHTDAYYSVVNEMNISEIMSYKYLPDVDGHTSSGRFLGYVRSLSLPIKSSIFAEWHDDRLIPWRHFVPMSVEYQEWWGLMQYFVGYKGEEGEVTISGHDEVAERIARQGSEWSHHIERQENMLVYFYRLILEYARMCADGRDHLGYVEDLIKTNTKAT